MAMTTRSSTSVNPVTLGRVENVRQFVRGATQIPCLRATAGFIVAPPGLRTSTTSKSQPFHQTGFTSLFACSLVSNGVSRIAPVGRSEAKGRANDSQDRIVAADFSDVTQ